MIERPNLSTQGEKLEDAGILHELIATRAYQRYEERGRVGGFDLLDWLQAEQEILHQLEHKSSKISTTD